MTALQTDILVYAHRAAAREHADAVGALERAQADPRGGGVASRVRRNFGASSPGPAWPSRLAEAAGSLADLETAGAQVWPAAGGFSLCLRAAAAALGLRGRRIYDLQIALISWDAGAEELWTHDAGFLRLPGLRWVDPLATAPASG